MQIGRCSACGRAVCLYYLATIVAARAATAGPGLLSPWAWRCRGCSSSGRASALQAEGSRFDSDHLHQQQSRGGGCFRDAAPRAHSSVGQSASLIRMRPVVRIYLGPPLFRAPNRRFAFAFGIYRPGEQFFDNRTESDGRKIESTEICAGEETHPPGHVANQRTLSVRAWKCCDQVTKGVWWMSWRQEPMKDVALLR